MGMYIFISEEDRKRMKRVDSDQELNELFQEALQYRPDLLISEYCYYKTVGNIFNRKKVKDFEYRLFVEENSYDGSAYQARYMSCAQSKETVIPFLYGVINAGLWVEKQKNNPIVIDTSKISEEDKKKFTDYFDGNKSAQSISSDSEGIMWDNQREAMFNGWKNSKLWIPYTVHRTPEKCTVVAFCNNQEYWETATQESMFGSSNTYNCAFDRLLRKLKEIDKNIEMEYMVKYESMYTPTREERKTHSFCEKPGENCTANFCDENGCQERKRNYVSGIDPINPTDNPTSL